MSHLSMQRKPLAATNQDQVQIFNHDMQERFEKLNKKFDGRGSSVLQRYSKYLK